MKKAHRVAAPEASPPKAKMATGLGHLVVGTLGVPHGSRSSTDGVYDRTKWTRHWPKPLQGPPQPVEVKVGGILLLSSLRRESLWIRLGINFCSSKNGSSERKGELGILKGS